MLGREVAHSTYDTISLLTKSKKDVSLLNTVLPTPWSRTTTRNLFKVKSFVSSEQRSWASKIKVVQEDIISVYNVSCHWNGRSVLAVLHLCNEYLKKKELRKITPWSCFGDAQCCATDVTKREHVWLSRVLIANTAVTHHKKPSVRACQKDFGTGSCHKFWHSEHGRN